MNGQYKFIWNMLINLLWVYGCYEIARLTFLFENWDFFQDTLSWKGFWEILHGGLLFDTSAICYTNSLYILLILFPLHYKETKTIGTITRWIFIITNSISIIANLINTVYFSYTRHCITANIFDEFSNESNLRAILGIELFNHWYLVVLAFFLIWGLNHFYRDPFQEIASSLKNYYLRHSIAFVIIFFSVISGMRGALLTNTTRPIAIGNALRYTNQPMEANIVLNTPFAILRTITKKPIRIPVYFTNHTELEQIYSPIHIPSDNTEKRKKNIVILIVESFAQEFVGALNHHLDNGQYQGYTPFVDSLLQHSLTFQETFCNTGFSIDAMPAVLASIPRMDEPFVLTPYALNDITSIASELNKWGYYTAFFHGAENNSMGFQAFSRSAGFQSYFGKTEYNSDSRFNGEKDFDGTWAIWDEPFLQYYCLKMNEMKEPFMTSMFTATSHHPFVIPEQYKEIFKDEGLYPLHKCIRYTDYALRKFFETASKQPWYNNTLFILTADHASSRITHAEYRTELGIFRVPILFFDPSGEFPVGCWDGIAQQIDIMPTILNYLGYNKPYIAFGKDLLHISPEKSWAFNWDHFPQLIKDNYLLQFDGEKVLGIYSYRTDRLLENNLKGKIPEEAEMEKEIKAIMQDCLERMEANKLTIESNNRKLE